MAGYNQDYDGVQSSISCWCVLSNTGRPKITSVPRYYCPIAQPKAQLFWPGFSVCYNITFKSRWKCPCMKYFTVLAIKHSAGMWLQELLRLCGQAMGNGGITRGWMCRTSLLTLTPIMEVFTLRTTRLMYLWHIHI